MLIESEELEHELQEVFEKIKSCYQCGTCAGGCSVFRVHPEFNPRKIMETLLSGETGNLFIDDLVWYCSLCYTCTSRCPQGVDVAHVLIDLKNIARKLKRVPPGIIAELEAIQSAGITAVISESVYKKREKLGLPKLPTVDTAEIQRLLESIGTAEALQFLETKPESDTSTEDAN